MYDNDINTIYELSEQQKKFCERYVICCNATQAAIEAGYPVNSAKVTGRYLLAKEGINNHINELAGSLDTDNAITINESDMIEFAKSIDKTYVLTKAIEVLNNCLSIKDNANALKALDIIGKHIDIKAFEQPKTEPPTNTNIINNLLPAPDLRRFIKNTGIATSEFIDSDEKILNIMKESVEYIDIIDK